jgi:hypothetical protein
LQSDSDETDMQSCFEIVKDGESVFSLEGYTFNIGKLYEKVDDSPSPLMTDITGEGLPDLVISEYTGGAHCCLFLHVFELGPEFRLIQTINVKHSDLAYFKNLDEDPALELPMNDWTFAYWHAAFADSPAPDVILKYGGRKYEMAADLMRRPARGTQELNELAADIISSPEWEDDYERVPVRLWAEMLDLIYTGNMAQAWILLDLAWPEGVEGKQEFLDAFKAQLQTSPFWQDIQALNQEGT